MIPLDAVSVRVHIQEVLTPLPNTPAQSPSISPVYFFDHRQAHYGNGVCYPTHTQFLVCKCDWFLAVKLLLPRQRQCSHFHKLSHYFSSFLNLLSVWCLFHLIRQFKSICLIFFSRKLLKNPGSLA